jgi:hypothetical protein
MITVYAHKFHDEEIRIYSDKLGMKRMAIFPNHLSNKPSKRNKYIMLNCYRYKLEWI